MQGNVTPPLAVPAAPVEQALYEIRKKIYPRAVRNPLRRSSSADSG